MKRVKKKKKTGKPTGLFLRFFLGLFLCAVIGGIGQQAYLYQQVKEEQALLTAEIEKEKEKQADFENQKEYYNSDSYIEQIAREQLGMIKPNEILYINRSE